MTWAEFWVLFVMLLLVGDAAVQTMTELRGRNLAAPRPLTDDEKSEMAKEIKARLESGDYKSVPFTWTDHQK